MTWFRRAACQDHDDVFHGANPTRALQICAECDVQDACLRDALAVERDLNSTEIVGVRGGLTAPQRRQIIRSQREGNAA